MWKNLKIRTKMLLGFTLVLVVFAISVVLTWSLMKGIADSNRSIIDKSIPAQTMTSTLDKGVYELFIAVRTLQYLENEAAYAEERARRAHVQKLMDEVTAFHAASPEIRATANLVENVLPKLTSYFKSVDDTVAHIGRKKTADDALVAASGGVTKPAGALQSSLLDGQAPTPALKRINAIVTQVGDARRVLLHANDTRNFALGTDAVKMIEDLCKEIEDFSASLIVQEHRRIAAELKLGAETYLEAARAYLAVITELNASLSDLEKILQTVNSEIAQAMTLSEERIKELSQLGLGELERSMTILFSSALLSIVLGIGIAFFISRSIARPLATIVELAKRAGGGDLTIQQEDFHYNGKDELGNLVDALSDMVTAQESAMEQVVSVSESLEESAGHISAISEETNESMREVKTSIDQVSALGEGNGHALQESNAGVEEMSAGADTVAQSATDSAAFISQTTEVSNRAIQTVNKVITGMRDVDASSKESESKMKQLVASVENVNSFVSVITGIADQTNLLALNAAIEAARAGEVGRGFAVVAEEVRQLAEESAKAAQNVNSIIGELQNGARENIKATTEAGRRLVDTLSQAEQAQTELNSALREMNKANNSIQSIAAVAQEQAASSKEVAIAIDNATRSTMEMVSTIGNIRRASDKTSQAAQGLAEQSSTMNRHADDLAELLSHFKLLKNTRPKGNPSLKALPGRKK